MEMIALSIMAKYSAFWLFFFQAEDGMTVLHYAAKAGYVDVLMTLLESDDADVNMQVSAIVVNKSIEKTLSTSFKQSIISDIEVWYSVEVLFDDSIGWWWMDPHHMGIRTQNCSSCQVLDQTRGWSQHER